MIDKLRDKVFLDNKFEGDLDGEGDGWGMRWRGMDRWRHELYLRAIKSKLQKPQPQTVLDIGAALCDFTIKAYELSPENKFYTTDLVEKAVQWSGEKFPQFSCALGAMPSIPFGLNFDVIMCLQVLCYLSEEDRRNSIENIYSRLNQDGIVLISGCLDGGIRHHTEKELRGYLEPKFNIEKVIYHHWHVYRTYYEAPLKRFNDNVNNSLEWLSLNDENFTELVRCQSSSRKLKLLSFLRPCSWIAKPFFQLFADLSKLMLSWRFVPEMLHYLTRYRGPAKADEIIIRARRL